MMAAQMAKISLVIRVQTRTTNWKRLLRFGLLKVCGTNNLWLDHIYKNSIFSKYSALINVPMTRRYT